MEEPLESVPKPDDGKAELRRQLVTLGAMMGAGLHHEPDGKWIAREYKKVLRLLEPEMFQLDKEARRTKNRSVDAAIVRLLNSFKCTKCGSALKQSRSGSLILYCISCGSRFKAGRKKRDT